MIGNSFPPPGPPGGMDRLRVWMQARKWRQWLVVGAMFFVGWVLLFATWIGIALWRGSTDRDASAVAMNYLLMPFIGTVLLTTVHRACYRWFWDADRKRALGTLTDDDRAFRLGSTPADPPPVIRWPWWLRLRHAVIYVLGIATLLYTFLPYGNQIAISRFVVLHSFGSATAGQLSTLLFGYLPIAVLGILSVILLSRQIRRRDAGLLGHGERILLEAEMNWLFAFTIAFGVAMLLCRIFGSMIMREL